MSMMDSLVQLAMRKLENNPDFQKEIQTNPVKKSYYDAIKSGNQTQGEELANTLLNTYGVSRDDGCKQAVQFLQNMVSGQR